MSRTPWPTALTLTWLLRLTASCSHHCPPCTLPQRPPASISVRPDPEPCLAIPDDPAPVQLGARPLAVGQWRVVDATNVPPDQQAFDGGQSYLVTRRAVQDLGAWVLGVRNVIAAQRACLDALRGSASAPAPASPVAPPAGSPSTP